VKHILLLVFLFSATFLMSCGTSQEVISFWQNPENPLGKPYTNVFVMAITADRAAQLVVESDIVAAAKSKGIKAVRSMDVLAPTLTKATPSKEEVEAKIRDSGCDGVFTVSLLDVKSQQRYVEGTTTYAGGAYAYSPYPHYGYYGSYYSYYSYSYPIASTPGYYTTDKTYFIEANMYDAGTEQIRWSMQSSAYNPSSLNSFSKEYTHLLIEELTKQNAKVTKTE
jgi:hypothetical protein